jgi:hypothetical protein
MVGAGDRLKKIFKLLFVLLILALIAVAVVPLNLYHEQIKSHLKPLTLTDIGGSAVKGSAGSMHYMGMPLGEAEWLLYPSSYDAIGGKVKVRDVNHDLTMKLAKIGQQEWLISSIMGYVDWQLIQPFVQIRYGQLSGYASFDLSGIEYSRKEGLQRMQGEITLKDFTMIKPSQKDLGEIKVSFTTQQAGIVVGQFSSQSNVISVTGTLLLNSNRWQLNVDLIPKAGHFELDALLSSVGQARRGGGRRLNLAGFY